jgi:hypothetical protein
MEEYSSIPNVIIKYRILNYMHLKFFLKTSNVYISSQFPHRLTVKTSFKGSLWIGRFEHYTSENLKLK